MSEIEDAAYEAVHSYPGGAKCLAARMGMSHQILVNKANPGNMHNSLSLNDAVRIQEFNPRSRILDAFAERCGHLLVKLPAPDAVVADMAIVEALGGLLAKNGEVGRSVVDALEDGRIDESEVDEIRRAAREAMTWLAGLVVRIESMR
jgi:hypothetical protein